MKNPSIIRICVCFYLVCSVAMATVLLRSGFRSKRVHLHPRSRSRLFGQESTLFRQPLESFNRPPGTVALKTGTDSKSFSNTYGRTFGQYGSYRHHKSWQQAVMEDNARHSLIRNNLKDTFPWLFKNLKTPSLRGFGLDGFWNSYTPYIPEGTPNVPGLGPQVRNTL